MKTILFLTITLQVVLCRPDVSHLSGHLGKGKGYKYDTPDTHFEEGPGDFSKGLAPPAELTDDGAGEYPDVFSALTPDSGSFAPDPVPAGPSPAELDIFSEVFPPLTGAIELPFGGGPNQISSSISSSSITGPNGQTQTIQSSISTGGAPPAGAGIGGVDATYIAGNPGVTHNAQLKGHSASQKFINLFTRD